MSESPNKRVLIVDNDEEEAARLGTELQRAGYDSNATWSGLDALKLLKSGTYDVLLVSSYLPDVYVGDFCAATESLAGAALHDCYAGGLHLGRSPEGRQKCRRREKVSGKIKAEPP